MSDTNQYYDSPDAMPEEENKGNLVLALIGGALGALAGAAIWAAVTVITEYQIGLLAIGVGALVGILVRNLGKGESILFGLIGALFAFAGCIAGNIFAIVFIVAGDFDMFFVILAELNLETLIEVLLESFHPMDLLFYGLAIFQGFKLAIVTHDYHKPQVADQGTQGELTPQPQRTDDQPKEY